MQVLSVLCIALALALRLYVYREQVSTAFGLLGTVKLRLEAGKGASEETKLIIIALMALAILAALILLAISKGAGKAASDISGP